MRPKFVLAIMLLVFVVMAVAVLLRPSKQPSQSQTPVPAVAVAPAAPANLPPPQPFSAPPAVATPPTPEERQAAIDAEKDQLYTWSMSGDSSNLPKILTDLNSPEKEIRLAAIEATKQFGDTNAIPVLKADAAKTDDSQEAIAMLQAADFIALPEAPLTAYDGSQPQTPQQAQAQAQSQAAAQARFQTRHQEQMQGQQPNTSPAPSQPAGN